MGELWQTVLKGGPIMVPLIICSIISIAVIIERYFFFRRTDNNNFKLFKKISRFIEEEKYTEAIRDLKGERGPVARIMATALTYRSNSNINFKEYIQNTGDQEVAKMEKNLTVLEVIATISPLLGLLGTVLGIIDSFDILSLTGGTANPAQLSSGIARALLTTAAGLFIAIPSTIFYTHFIGILNKRIREINRWTREMQVFFGEEEAHV